MNEKTLDLLRDLAAKLGLTVEHLWPHAVRYAVIDGLSCWLFGFPLVIACMVAWGKWKPSREPGDDLGFVISRVVLVVGLLVGAVFIAAPLGQIFEPTGYVVFKALKGGEQ